MKAIGETVLLAVAGLVVLATVAPRLISLSHALVPVLIVAVVGAVLLRLVFFHTRRF